jgi:cyclohexa-1,5-dienecarbonyl-CoA hydratase
VSVAAEATTRVEATLLEEGRLLRLGLAGARGNVLAGATCQELSAALERHRDDPHLRLVLLTAAGDHFCYGASVAEHRRQEAPSLLAAFHAVTRAIFDYPVPVAAVVQGHCLGAGFELALACHFRFAAANARFACPEIRLGVFPPVLAALAGLGLAGPAAEELLLTGRTVDAEEADQMGLLTRRLAGGEEPEAEVLAWYRELLAPLSAFALRQGVRALRRTSGLLARFEGAMAAAETQYLEEVLPSHDGNEGITAFLERRKPAWRDA